MFRRWQIFYSPEPSAAPAPAETPAPAPAAPPAPTPGSAETVAAETLVGTEEGELPQQESPRVTGLTDVQLKENIEALYRGEKPPHTVPAKETPGAATSSPEKKDEPPAPGAQPGAADKKDEAPAPGAATPPEKLLAGKYKTEADLEAGVLAAAKQLKYDEGFLKAILETARETKDYKPVEKAYLYLQGVLSKGPGPAAQGAPPAEAPRPATAPPELTRDPAVIRAVHDSVIDQLNLTGLGAQFRERGFNFPSSDVELTALWKEDPELANRYEAAYKESWKFMWDEAIASESAATSVEATNKQTTDTDITGIREFAKANDTTVTDEEINAFVASVQNDPRLRETRHGVDFLVAGALKDLWVAREFPKKLPEVFKARDTKARLQAAADLKRLGQQGVESISTAGASGKQAQVEDPKVNLKNADDVAKLSTSDLNAKIKETFRRIGAPGNL